MELREGVYINNLATQFQGVNRSSIYERPRGIGHNLIQLDTTRGIFHTALAVVGNGPVMINSLVVLFYLSWNSPLRICGWYNYKGEGMDASNQLKIEHVKISKLKAATYNPRTWSEETKKQLTDSISQFGLVDPLLVNGATNRKNIVIGGHFRLYGYI